MNKDRTAFGLLHDTYSPALHGSLREIMRDKDIAAHVLRSAFVSAYYTVRSYKRHRQELYMWMLHIALRLTLEPLRAMRDWPNADQLDAIKANLSAVLQGMAPIYQAVIHLTYNAGLSRREAAMRLNIPVSHVDELLQAALQALQDYLNNYYWHDCNENKE